MPATETVHHYYVLDHNTELVGPTTIEIAQRIGFYLLSLDLGYNVYSVRPDYPTDGHVWNANEWIQANLLN